MDRKAAAEARRAKLLARGGDRLAKITGNLGIPDADPPSVVEGDAGAPQQPAQPADVPLPPPLAAAANLGTQPVAAAPVQAAASPAPPSLQAELSAAVRTSLSAQSLPEAQQRAKGTATKSKWAQYEASSCAAARPQRRRRSVTVGETLHAAVRSTSRLRLLLAALLAVLLASRWDAAAVLEGAAPSSAAGSKPESAAPRSSAAPDTSSSASLAGLAEVGRRWQAIAQHARQAAAAVLSHGDRQLAAAAGSPACQQASAVLQAARRRLAAAAASPAVQAAGAVAQQARAQLAAALASPAARHAQQAARGAAANLGQGWRLARQQLAAARDSRAWQAAGAALARLPPAASLPALVQRQLAAAVASPAGQRVVQALDRLPPLASLLLLDMSIVGAAAVAMAAAPGLVHSTLELDLQVPGLLQRAAALVPGLSRQLSMLAALPRLLTSLLDDAAAFMVALVCYNQLPLLAAAA